MFKLDLLPERSNYTYTGGNTVVSVELEGGYSRSRVDVVNAAARIKCQWILNREEYNYFRSFYNGIAARGANQFTIDLILDKSYTEEYTAKFVPGSVEMSDPVGMSFRCSAELEVVPINRDGEDEITIMFWPLLTDDPIFNAIAQFANYDLEV